MAKTGMGSLVSVLFGMAAVKIIASRLGPEALGSFSIVKQTIVMGSTIFITGGQTALVQGMAVRTGAEKRRYISTACVLLCGGSIVLGALVALSATWHAWESPLAVGGSGMTGTWVGLAIAVAGPMAFVFGVLNGSRCIGRLAIAQGCNAAILAAAVFIFAKDRGSSFPGMCALLLGASQVPGLLLGIVFLVRSKVLEFWPTFDSESVRHFARIGFATLLAACLQAATVLIVRKKVATGMGVSAAGIFDAGWTVSMVYLMLVLGSFSTYYLPTLAGDGERRLELIDDVLRTSLLVVVPLIALMIAVRSAAIVILYSPAFLPATRMMHWMFLGDFFKVLSFVLAMPMIAFGDTRAFLKGEIGWNLAMIAGVEIALRNGREIEWVGLVFALSYLGYFMYSFNYCRSTLGWRVPKGLWVPLVSSVAVLTTASILSWSATRVSWTTIAITSGFLVVHCILLLRRNDARRVRVTLASGVNA